MMKKKKKPDGNTLRIEAFGQLWNIKWLKEHEHLTAEGEPDEQGEKANPGNFGFCDIPNNTIFIWSGARKDQQKATLLHELIEVINYNFEMNLNHSQIMTLETAFNTLVEWRIRRSIIR